MQISNFTASFSAFAVSSNPYSSTQGLLASIYLFVDSASLLSSVIVTFRWTDPTGAQSQVLALPLTLLTNKTNQAFPVLLNPTSDLTMEAVLTGSGSFNIGYGFASV